MLRRLLACLLALTIALPSAAMSLPARAATSECECPPAKSDCGEKQKACDCGLACTMRTPAAEPAQVAAAAPAITMALTAERPMTRAGPLPAAPFDIPFRPPRPTISC